MIAIYLTAFYKIFEFLICIFFGFCGLSIMTVSAWLITLTIYHLKKGDIDFFQTETILGLLLFLFLLMCGFFCLEEFWSYLL